MFRKKRLISLVLLVLMLLMSVVSIPMSFAEETKNATILFTHDMHAHFLPTKGEGGTLQGGYARLKTAIDSQKERFPDALLLDGGDFSMGTLFQTLYKSDAPDLQILGQLGYDAVALGNHEFDFTGEGFADMLDVARESGKTLPSIMLSNYTFPADANGELNETLTAMKNSMEQYPVLDYKVFEKDGVKIGVFALMGIEAADYSPMSDIEFTNQIENAKRVTKQLRETQKVDMIVCLSHSGTWADAKKSEDEILAAKVPDIDIIVSGHTHTKLEQPIMIGKTIIASCGSYGENLGVIDVAQKADGSWGISEYSLQQINSSLAENPEISQTVEEYKALVQQEYLERFDMQFDQVLAYSDFDFIPFSKFGEKLAEDTLGNLLTDGYIYAVKELEGDSYEPIAAAIVPEGVIRGSFSKGNITVSDVFNADSLGSGADGVSGYPLISVYLTGKELKNVCEMDASVTPIMAEAQLYSSGLSYTLNPNRLIFNKVIKCNLQLPDGTLQEIDEQKLYRVVTGLYSAQMLSVVGEKSFGLLSIIPKDKDGVPITDFNAHIIYGENYELKEWLSLAQYLSSFSQKDGIAQVPAYYQNTQNRKIVEDNSNIFAVLAQPNGIALLAYGLVLLAACLFVFAVVMICTRKRRKAKRLLKKQKSIEVT